MCKEPESVSAKEREGERERALSGNNVHDGGVQGAGMKAHVKGARVQQARFHCE